jgi:hypothetical protein
LVLLLGKLAAASLLMLLIGLIALLFGVVYAATLLAALLLTLGLRHRFLPGFGELPTIIPDWLGPFHATF